MKKKIGIVIDILMYGILLVQMLYVFLGNTAHEILGIAFFVCLVCHIIIKRSWFKTLLKKGKKPLPRRIFNWSTSLLMLSIIALMLSSLDVSRLLFPRIRIFGDAALHRYLATAVLALSVLHGGMRGYIHTKKKKRAAVLTAIGTAAAVAVGLYLVPYLNRHFKTVRIHYADAVEGEQVAWNGSKPLVVYFTRIGNTDFAPDVDAVSGASLLLADGELMGNTELLSDMIENAIDCDVRAITLTGKHYPSSYGDTVSAAGKELNSKARPEIEPIDISGYDSVILVYPIWWGTVPMPVATFLESNDFTGKNLYLIATQGSSGFVDSTKDIRSMAKGANVTELISIYCDDIPKARDEICRKLKKIAP
ncbi:MAG: hypothetical protein IJ060_01675 [Oscillospiraceae bacterium]|nr:hypothetical protein [Oscillospiraceae bacterium]